MLEITKVQILAWIYNLKSFFEQSAVYKITEDLNKSSGVYEGKQGIYS